jgi:hypothetical protein
MNALQRDIFEETLRHQASLEAQPAAPQGVTPDAGAPQKEPRRQPSASEHCQPTWCARARVDQRTVFEDTLLSDV